MTAIRKSLAEIWNADPDSVKLMITSIKGKEYAQQIDTPTNIKLSFFGPKLLLSLAAIFTPTKFESAVLKERLSKAQKWSEKSQTISDLSKKIAKLGPPVNDKIDKVIAETDEEILKSHDQISKIDRKLYKSDSLAEIQDLSNQKSLLLEKEKQLLTEAEKKTISFLKSEIDDLESSIRKTDMEIIKQKDVSKKIAEKIKTYQESMSDFEKLIDDSDKTDMKLKDYDRKIKESDEEIKSLQEDLEKIESYLKGTVPVTQEKGKPSLFKKAPPKITLTKEEKEDYQKRLDPIKGKLEEKRSTKSVLVKEQNELIFSNAELTRKKKAIEREFDVTRENFEGKFGEMIKKHTALDNKVFVTNFEKQEVIRTTKEKLSGLHASLSDLGVPNYQPKIAEPVPINLTETAEEGTSTETEAKSEPFNFEEMFDIPPEEELVRTNTFKTKKEEINEMSDRTGSMDLEEFHISEKQLNEQSLAPEIKLKDLSKVSSEKGLFAELRDKREYYKKNIFVPLFTGLAAFGPWNDETNRAKLVDKWSMQLDKMLDAAVDKNLGDFQIPQESIDSLFRLLDLLGGISGNMLTYVFATLKKISTPKDSDKVDLNIFVDEIINLKTPSKVDGMLSPLKLTESWPLQYQLALPIVISGAYRIIEEKAIKELLLKIDVGTLLKFVPTDLILLLGNLFPKKIKDTPLLRGALKLIPPALKKIPFGDDGKNPYTKERATLIRQIIAPLVSGIAMNHSIKEVANAFLSPGIAVLIAMDANAKAWNALQSKPDDKKLQDKAKAAEDAAKEKMDMLLTSFLQYLPKFVSEFKESKEYGEIISSANNVLNRIVPDSGGKEPIPKDKVVLPKDVANTNWIPWVADNVLKPFAEGLK